MKTVIDKTNSAISILKSPLRIVSLVPSQTELLIALGLEKYIVGITKFCIHPNYLTKTKTVVGGTKNIHTDRIKAINPTIILCNKEENTKEIVTQCREIAPTHVSDIFTLDDALELMFQYGQLFNCEKKATEIIDKITDSKNELETFISNKNSLNVAYFIWKKPWMVAANITFINHLLKLNKFENCFQNLERYPEINIEKLDDKNLDVIFLSSEPYPFKKKHITELKEKFTKTKIILVDGEYFSWYGSRLLGAFEYFKKLRITLSNSQ